MSSPQPSIPAPADSPTASTSSQTQPSTPSTSTAAGLPQLVKNDPKRTGFDPQTAWWVNYFKILTGSITPEGAFHYRESRYVANEERDCRQCEKWRDFALQHSPTVVFLRQKIAALNGRLDGSNVVCARCPARLTEDGQVHRQSGGFDPGSGILICANEIRSQSHLEDTLSHEMVHAWDHLRWKMDWVGDKDLKQAACTEIRASMLSGECRWTKEAITRGNWTLTQQFQDCVRKRAVESLLARPRCKDDVQAVKVVNQVWDSCFSDTRPFDEVYR
ncbi:peptidase M76 family-domain-containing protein [Xylaria arbuscula]|nr:peptidase M76 family-domain-containing protein [Xylaria arbuscula]